MGFSSLKAIVASLLQRYTTSVPKTNLLCYVKSQVVSPLFWLLAMTRLPCMTKCLWKVGLPLRDLEEASSDHSNVVFLSLGYYTHLHSPSSSGNPCTLVIIFCEVKTAVDSSRRIMVYVLYAPGHLPPHSAAAASHQPGGFMRELTAPRWTVTRNSAPCIGEVEEWKIDVEGIGSMEVGKARQRLVVHIPSEDAVGGDVMDLVVESTQRTPWTTSSEVAGPEGKVERSPKSPNHRQLMQSDWLRSIGKTEPYFTYSLARFLDGVACRMAYHQSTVFPHALFGYLSVGTSTGAHGRLWKRYCPPRAKPWSRVPDRLDLGSLAILAQCVEYDRCYCNITQAKVPCSIRVGWRTYPRTGSLSGWFPRR